MGDVSPEELRSLAYEGAKQGLSLKDVVRSSSPSVYNGNVAEVRRMFCKDFFRYGCSCQIFPSVAELCLKVLSFVLLFGSQKMNPNFIFQPQISSFLANSSTVALLDFHNSSGLSKSSLAENLFQD